MSYTIFPSLRHYIDAKAEHLYQGFLIDIDGTLKVGNRMLPNANEALAYLHATGYPYLLATNDAGCSLPAKAASLQRMGIPIEHQHIFCCAESLKQYAREHRLAGLRFFVLGRLGEPCYAEDAGILVERDPNLAYTCAGVIVNELGYDWEPSINAAVNLLLRRPEAIFIAPNPDNYWRSHSGEGINIGAGAIVDLILRIVKKNGITITPIYLGKPNRVFFRNAIRKMTMQFGKMIDKKDVLVIGDSVYSDICGAHANGMRAALVLTGATSITTLESIKSKRLIPEIVLERI